MAKDLDWIRPAMALLVAQYACALLISRLVDFHNLPPASSYMIMAAVLATLGALAIFLVHLWRLWRRGIEFPISHIRRHGDRWAAISYFLGFQMVALQISALTWLKEMIPHAIPYWADPALAQFDRIMLGVDAWRLVPQSVVGALDVLYTTWAPFKFFALMLMLAAPASALKSRAMLSYFMTVGLVGVAGEYLLSSGGPIFYDRLEGGQHFADLIAQTREHAPVASKASDYLWESYLRGDDRIGNGISAMPSMHVATTVWAALAIGSLWSWARIPVWLFAFVILAGSVALGWHYLSDGLVGGLGALICWMTAPTIVDRLRRLHFGLAPRVAEQRVD